MNSNSAEVTLPHQFGTQSLDRSADEGSDSETDARTSSQSQRGKNTEYVKFPTHLFPEPIGGFIRATANSLRVDESFVALPLMAALASAVGNTRRISLKADWQEPMVLWTVIIGHSGTGKTPAFQKALHTLSQHQLRAFRDYDEAQEKYEVERTRHLAADEQWKRSKKGGSEPPPVAPVLPPIRRYVVNDITVEALAPRLLDNPRGVLLGREELSGWFASFDAYKKSGGADSAHWLSMFGANLMTVDRKGGDRPVTHVPRAAVCVTGGIQPAILAAALKGRSKDRAGNEHIDSGMAARLLMAMPPASPATWTDDVVDPRVLTSVENLFDCLLELEFEPDKHGEPAPIDVRLSPEAKAAFIEYYNKSGQKQCGLSGELTAVWSKLRGYAARLALLIHLIKSCSQVSTASDPVDDESMRAGIALARWFGNEAERVYATIGTTPLTTAEENQQQLLSYIRRRGRPVTPREVMRDGPKAFRTNSGEVEMALQELATAGHGRWQDRPSGNRGHAIREFVLRDTSA